MSGSDGRDQDDGANEEPRRNTRANVVVAVITVLLIGGGIWLAHVLSDMRKLQDCILSGRSNCAPIASEESGR